MNRREFIKAIGAGALSLYAANYAKAAPGGIKGPRYIFRPFIFSQPQKTSKPFL